MALPAPEAAGLAAGWALALKCLNVLYERAVPAAAAVVALVGMGMLLAGLRKLGGSPEGTVRGGKKCSAAAAAGVCSLTCHCSIK